MHFPGSHLRLMLSVILPCEARTFLTVIPFGVIPRDRLAELLYYYNIRRCECQVAPLSFSRHIWRSGYKYPVKSTAFVDTGRELCYTFYIKKEGGKTAITTFIECFLEIVGLSCLPLLLIGLAVWACRELFCFFVGNNSGRPLVKALSVLSTPLREAGHVMMAVIFWHRVEDMQLLNLNDPDGEFGFVEHSYNPRNPVALLGNFFYALGPAVLGLLLVFLIFLTCFHGVLPSYFEEVKALGEAGAGIGGYLKAVLLILPQMFTAGDAGVIPRIIGCALLLLICFGIHISPAEIFEAVSGILIFGVLALAASGVMMLFDDRVMRIALSGFRSFSTVVTALYMVVLIFATAALVLGMIFGVIRTLFNIDTTEQFDDETFDE